MSGRTLSVYESADWGSRLAGVALVHRDAAGVLFVDDIRVESIDVSGQFSVLRCADGRTRPVLTSFLRLVPDPRLGK
jgi:hypothetical protein